MQHKIIPQIFITFLLIACSFGLMAQGTTVIKGHVIDANTKEDILYVSMQVDDSNIGTTSDINGKFYIETTKPVKQLKINYLGYKPQIINIKQGQVNDLVIALVDESFGLDVVELKAEKYTNKDNPAVALIKKVIEHKDKNRSSAFEYYSFNKHEKLEFSLNNVTEKMRNNFIFKRFKFIFDNADTNKVTGKVQLPIFLKENISDVYYRKQPKSKKEHVRAERITNLDDIFNGMGISELMNNMYQEVDFYDNTIMLLSNGFVSPLSPISPTIYRFYIQDTTVINNVSLIHLYFAPRTKTDFAFMGHMWVANDTTYALHKIEAGIPNDINLNWVKEMQISQEYDWITQSNTPNNNPTRGLMLTKDDVLMDFGVSKKDSTRSILGRKSTSFKDISINTPIQDSFFRVPGAVFIQPGALKKNDAFWEENRHVPLSDSEMGIYQMVDSLKNYKPFKRLMAVGRLIIEGYTPIGGFDLGPANTFYSFNAIEGFRLRVGGRTNLKFSERVLMEGYVAYGFKDEKFKSYAALRYNFGSARLMRFPYNQLKVYYQNEIKIPGQDLQFIQEDNILLSFKRGLNNKMLYIETAGIEYQREYESGFSYTTSAKKVIQSPAGALLFDYDSGEQRLYKGEIMNTEIGIKLRYAPNEKFYEGATYRTPILNKYPIFELRYSAGIKSPTVGDYSYHNIHVKAKKVFYLAPFGYSELIVEGGRIFGQVPYTLLTAHRANQTYAYQLESYNLMNFLEFVSDKYVSINYHHNFRGVFFGRIPLIKKLNWREVFTFKSLWGGLDAQNRPNSTNELLRFPVDESGQLLTYTLDAKPYIETSVGISNIFKVLRVDYVRRLNYNENPNVSKWGIRARVKFEF